MKFVRRPTFDETLHVRCILLSSERNSITVVARLFKVKLDLTFTPGKNPTKNIGTNNKRQADGQIGTHVSVTMERLTTHQHPPKKIK
jgi:hypothetical protein